MLVSRAQELPPSFTLTLTSSCTLLSTLYSSNPFLSLPMRSSLSLLRSLSLSLSHHHPQPHHFHRRSFLRAISTPLLSSSPKPHKSLPLLAAASSSSSHSTFVEHLASEIETEENWDFNNTSEGEAAFDFDKNLGSLDFKHVGAPTLDVKELEELPEQWRRSKLAWLCKELPAHKAGTLVRILNAQRKWMRQEDATYVAVHCTRNSRE
jgi:hypothetical protein